MIKKSGIIACLSAAVLSLATSASFAQRSSRPTVVVVDVGRVFKEHIRFNAQLKSIKDDVVAYENVIRGKRERIEGMAQEAEAAGVRSEKYKQLERQAASAMSDLQVDMNLKKKEFMEEEARLYYDVYAEVTRTIAQFANEEGIRIVLRYTSEPMDRTDRNSVLQGINNNVVFQRDLDITNVIIERCNQGGHTANQGNRVGPALPPSGPRQR